MEIAGRTVLVTGGGSGLGAATARMVVSQGGSVVVADLDGDRGRRVADELGERARFVATDVTDEASVRGAVGAAMETGGLHAAVSCAGIARAERVLGREGPHPLARSRPWSRSTWSAPSTSPAWPPTVMAGNEPGPDGERGVIVNTASVAAFEGQIGQAAYSASKGGVVGMTLPMARDLARFGIRVMAVAPGIFDTPMLAGMPDAGPRVASAPRSRSPRASADPTSTPPWSATSSRTPCSTARSSASTAPSAWPPGNRRIRVRP